MNTEQLENAAAYKRLTVYSAGIVNGKKAALG